MNTNNISNEKLIVLFIGNGRIEFLFYFILYRQVRMFILSKCRDTVTVFNPWELRKAFFFSFAFRIFDYYYD
jgi:hypothetical protein